MKTSKNKQETVREAEANRDLKTQAGALPPSKGTCPDFVRWTN